MFDENQKMTYDNPVYLEQKNRKHEEVDNSGFIIPKQLTEEEMMKDETLDSNIEEITEDVDDDWDEEEIEVPDMIGFKKKSPEEIQREEQEVEDFIAGFDDESEEYVSNKIEKDSIMRIKIPSKVDEKSSENVFKFSIEE